MGQAILTGKSGVNYLLKTGQVAYGSFTATSSTSPSYTFPNIGFQPTAMCIWTNQYLDYSGYDYTATIRFCPYIAKINDAPFDVFVSGYGDIDENLTYAVNSGGATATVKQENTITCTYDAATDSVIVTCGYNPNSDAYRCVPWRGANTMWFLFMNGEAQSITTTAQTTALQVPSKKQPQVGLAYCDKRNGKSNAWIQLCLPDCSFYADGYTQNNITSGYHHKINGGKMTFDAANEMAIFAAPSWTAGTTYYMLG